MALERLRWLSDAESSLADVVAGVLGTGLLVASWHARHQTETYAVAMLGFGAFFLAIAFYRRVVKSASVGPGGMAVEMHDREAERDAAATAAVATIDDLVRAIESTDTGPPSASADDATVIGNLNFIAGERAIRSILEDAVAQGPLQACDLRLYLFDDDLGALAPVFGSADATTTWPPRRGATGVAWSTQQYALATGDAVHDSTFGLTPSQSERYSSLTAVPNAAPAGSTGPWRASSTLDAAGTRFAAWPTNRRSPSRSSVTLVPWDSVVS
ncbi:MAG TPA: hypothetical protein VK507_25635 [Iamia sp.]|nr:hypothetical protein [Iamia sp.]